MAVSLDFETQELQRFADQLERMGTLPQKCVTRAARSGAKILQARMRSIVPVGKTGELRRGIELHGERHRGKTGKKVYEVRMSPSKNDVFQKPIAKPGSRGGHSKTHAYYPASAEFGFMTRHPEGGYRYIPGQHFMREAAEAVESSVKRAMIVTLTDELEKEWRKRT